MRTRYAIVLLGLVGVVALASCGDDSGSSAAPKSTTGTSGLAGTAWKLKSYKGDNVAAVPAAPGAVASLAFAASGDLTGTTGCNNFAGTYKVDGKHLTITLGPMTRAACTSAVVTAQENALVALLPTVTGFTSTADALTLTGSGGAVLLTYSPGLTTLEGTSWVATGVNNGKEAVTSTAGTEKLTATFGPSGAFSGFGGCNQLRGTYTTTGTDGLTITGIASTMMACDNSELETEYTAALGKVTTFAIVGDQLTLRDSTGATQVTFQLAP